MQMAKIRVISEDDLVEYDTENQKDLATIRQKMRKATRSDWQIVEGCSEFPYAAAFYGCYDMAHFKRKADLMRFIDSFPVRTQEDKSGE